jgi:hypothetical protein
LPQKSHRAMKKVRSHIKSWMPWKLRMVIEYLLVATHSPHLSKKGNELHSNLKQLHYDSFPKLNEIKLLLTIKISHIREFYFSFWWCAVQYFLHRVHYNNDIAGHASVSLGQWNRSMLLRWPSFLLRLVTGYWHYDLFAFSFGICCLRCWLGFSWLIHTRKFHIQHNRTHTYLFRLGPLHQWMVSRSRTCHQHPQ